MRVLRLQTYQSFVRYTGDSIASNNYRFIV